MAAGGRQLLVLDFDHTIIDDNSDTAIWRLCRGGSLPEQLARQRRNLPWTQFVQAVLDHLHRIGRGCAEIVACVSSLPLTSGIAELMKGCTPSSDIIIVSDSNTIFIDALLSVHQLQSLVLTCYSNRAHVTPDGRLVVQPYEEQSTCSRCPVNMCKGNVLSAHLYHSQQRGAGYSRVVYVGDGANDLCPCLRLGAGDLICARAGYSLEKLVQQYGSHVQAPVVCWADASHLLTHL